MGFLDDYTDPDLGGARKAKGQGRSGSHHGNRQQLRRVASRTPEVMVKVTSHSKTRQQVSSHLRYISRKGDLPVHTSDGDRLEGQGAHDHIAAIWAEDANRSNSTARPSKTRVSTNIVLSMPKGKPDKILAAAQDFAHNEFSNHDWAMALHTDTNHPHVHLTVRNRGKDYRRLHMPKGKTQEWRESLAESLRAHGIEAEATRRYERGVTRKGENQTVRHIRNRKTPDVYKNAMREAEMRRRGQYQPHEPWRDKIEARQQEVRGQWRKAIEHERRHGSKELAQVASKYLDAMPPVETRADEMVRFLQERQDAKSRPAGERGRETDLASPERARRLPVDENEQDGPER